MLLGREDSCSVKVSHWDVVIAADTEFQESWSDKQDAVRDLMISYLDDPHRGAVSAVSFTVHEVWHPRCALQALV